MAIPRDAGQTVPIDASGNAAAAISGAALVDDEALPHALSPTHAARRSADRPS